MKQPKKPTREQKVAMYNNLLNWKNWMVIKEDESYIYIISKTGKQRRTISKYGSKRGRKVKGSLN